MIKIPKLAGSTEQGKTPQSWWERILTSTPIVLTVIATLQAGLSSSEMTGAQYERSRAAQNQSKAGDQWNFFQVKRIRGSNKEDTRDLLQGLAPVGRFEPAAMEAMAQTLPQRLEKFQEEMAGLRKNIAMSKEWLGQVAGPLDEAIERQGRVLGQDIQEARKLQVELLKLLAERESQQSLQVLATGQIPVVQDKVAATGAVKRAIQAIEARKDKEEIASLVNQVNHDSLEQSLKVAEGNVVAFDAVTGPVNKVAERLRQLLARTEQTSSRLGEIVTELGPARSSLGQLQGAASSAMVKLSLGSLLSSADSLRTQIAQVRGSFAAARLHYLASRYEAEARYNMVTAQLYELHVRKAEIASEHHRVRSKRFFYGMLAAQAGVITASLALAVRQRSLLWGFASAAGLVAISFGAYVYLFV